MKGFNSLASAVYLAAVVVFAGALAGCSMDDVELNGGVFDALGINNKTKAPEPKMANRTGLIVPPNLERLPPPGAQPGSQFATASVDALDDPDKKYELSQAELQKQQAEYCEKHYNPNLEHVDGAASLVEGPLGPCRKSLLNAFKQKQ